MSIYPRLKLYTNLNTYFNVFKSFFINFNSKYEINSIEKKIAKKFNFKNFIFTSMGRMGMYEALRALKVNGEIITSPITVPDCISTIIATGNKPVFCDVDLKTWNLDLDKIESLINSSTIAIVTTYKFGNTYSAHKIKKICDKYNILMIEDCAQAFGIINKINLLEV